jgi:hypothetical protein
MSDRLQTARDTFGPQCYKTFEGALGAFTPRAVLEKFAAVQMLDVHLPTTDGREVVLTRYTQPEKELLLLLDQLKLTLPAQPPPKLTTPAKPT